MLIVKILHDLDAIDPTNEDGWTVYSFNRRHHNFIGPGWVGDIRDKIECGLAFELGYFEHGQCSWFLRNERPAGTSVDFQWDGVDFAGFLVWEDDPENLGPKTLEDRTEDARRFLEAYTSWANGDVYGYVVENEDGECIDSCFGFLGNDLDYMFDQIRKCVGDQEFTVHGECAIPQSLCM